MCVAVLIQSEKRIPSEHLKAMADANPHGGGVAWLDGNLVQYRKGLTWQQIDAIQDMIPRPFFMHFRIATRGGKIPELTHPFPLGMQSFTEDLIGLAPGVLIHNGTWGGFREYVPAGIDPNAVSDTQVAAYVADTNEDILDKVDWSNAIMRAKDGKAEITLRGRWNEFQGNQYSNMHWTQELSWKTRADNWQDFYGFRGSSYPTRKKGETKSHQTSNLGPMNQANGKTVGKGKDKKRARRDTLPMVPINDNHTEGLYDNDTAWTDEDRNNAYEEWLRTRSAQNQSVYDRAKERYQQSISSGEWGSEGRLFTPEELRGTPSGRMAATASQEVLCPDCNEEIETIPCKCGLALASVGEGGYEEISIEDLSEEERSFLGIELEPSDGVPGEVIDTVSGPLDLNDVEDMNAEGMSYYKQPSHSAYDNDEEEMSEICLSGDTPEEWRKVDEYIRSQGIKI